MENFLHLIGNELCCYEYDISYSDYKDEDGNTLLQIAYEKNTTLFDFLLLSSKIDINNVNKYGKTIFDQALEKNDDSLIKINGEYHSELTIIKRIGGGTYGEVYLAKDNNGAKYALKKSSDQEFRDNLTFDMFKEVMILKTIRTNSMCKFYGTFRDQHNDFYIVLEYIKYTLRDILIIFSKFNVDCKKDSLMEIFKNLIIAVNELNEYGICHFDLNPANIMVTRHLEVKLIDMGFSTFIGLEKNKIDNYLETYCVKAPDDSLETFCYLNGKNIQFAKLKNYRVDYSSDMFSIGVIIFNAITGQRPETMIQLLTLKNSCYYFRRAEGETVKLVKLPHAMKITIEMFSNYAMDFLAKSMAVDSCVRITCREALNHPFFGGNITECKQEYYSITDVHVYNYMEHEMYTSQELILNNHELKYSDQIFDKYSRNIIQMSEYDPGKEIVNSTNLKKYIEFGFDKYCNYLVVDSFFFTKYGTYLNEDNMNITINLLGAFLENYMQIKDNRLFFELKYLLIQSNICFIPFKSLLIQRTNKLRIEGHCETDISRFYCKTHCWLINFLSNKRKHNISINELLDIFEDLAFLRRIGPSYVWVLEKIQD